MPENALVYEADPINFGAISEIISRVRNGDVDAYLARIVLKQVDSALALFGKQVVGPFGANDDKSLLEMCDMLESKLPTSFEAGGSMNVLEIAQLLFAIWKLVQPLINSN